MAVSTRLALVKAMRSRVKEVYQTPVSNHNKSYGLQDNLNNRIVKNTRSHLLMEKKDCSGKDHKKANEKLSTTKIVNPKLGSFQAFKVSEASSMP